MALKYGKSLEDKKLVTFLEQNCLEGAHAKTVVDGFNNMSRTLRNQASPLLLADADNKERFEIELVCVDISTFERMRLEVQAGIGFHRVVVVVETPTLCPKSISLEVRKYIFLTL